MKRLLFGSILLSSSFVYGGWTYYEFGGTAVPQASCLEMICPHGCVERSETLEGKCCPEPTLTSCQSEQLDEFGCPLCKCSDGFELWQGKCIEKCDEKYGLSGERDEHGNCICTPGMEGCCPTNSYYSESDNSSCTCLPCPTFDTSGWEKYCTTECKFTPDDPIGCCKMVVLDGIKNCLENPSPRIGLKDAWLYLGKLDGKYRISYVSGGIKLSRFKDLQYFWHIPQFYFSQNGINPQLLPSTSTYPSLEQLKSENEGKSTEVTCQANTDYGIYMHDGDYWSSVCGSGHGCTDNCGQVKFLFEKISGCPENSSTEVSSWQIGSTECYCQPGFVLNDEGTGCKEGCQSYLDCPNGYFCDMTGNITNCSERPTAGTCREAKKKRIFPKYDFYTYDGVTTLGKYKNTGGMDWWSAMDFCAAIKEPSVSYKDYCSNENTTGSYALCNGYRGIGDCPAFNIGSNNNDYWLSDLLKSDSCYAYDLTFAADLCAGNGTDKTKDYDRDSPRYALCGTGSIEITSKPFNCRNGTCTSDLNKGDWQFVRDNYLIYVEPRFDGFGDMHSAYWITELLGPYNSDYTLHASGIVDDRLYIRYFDKNNKMINEEQIHSCDYGGANSSFKNKTVNIPAGQKFRLYVYSWDGPVGWMCDQYGNNCSTKDTLILKLKK